MARIDAFFKLMSEQKASDLHLSTNNPPDAAHQRRTRAGRLSAAGERRAQDDGLRDRARIKIKIFEETGDVDFGYEIPGVARFRANFFNQKNGISAVFRQIPIKGL